jgi:hypothetical protein
MLSICAIIAAHNGGMTLDRVLQHFEDNNIEVYVLDHGSSDSTTKIVEGRMGHPVIARQPYEFDGVYRWRELLRLKEEILQGLAHDWVIHADADEIMESSREGETLRSMIERLDAEGCDIIDCDEFVFVPGDTEPSDFFGELRHYYHFAPVGRTLHRAQRLRNASLNWSRTGGHGLEIEGKKVAAEKIRLRHYIGVTFDHLKSQYLGRVFDGGELSQGWHNNRVATTPEFVVKPDRERLINLDRDGWRTQAPEQKHLLFSQPWPYGAPATLEKSKVDRPFPFIVGVGRSGSTLLRLMVDAHPGIVITPETHWLRAAISDLRDRPDDPENAKRRILDDPSWADMGISGEQLEEVFAAHVPEEPMKTIRNIYSVYGQAHGVARVGDKTPLHGLIMYDIARAFSDAHFIHIIRDGRDVATSYRDLWFGPGNDPQDAAVFWMWRIREIRQQAQFVPNYLEVRYEDLVTDPEPVLRAIGQFISLPFHPSQLAAHERAAERLKELKDVQRGGETTFAELRQGIHHLTTRKPDPKRIGRWRSEMTDAQVKSFESVAGDMLADLGYERAAR